MIENPIPTPDSNLVQTLLRKGKITPEEAARLPAVSTSTKASPLTWTPSDETRLERLSIASTVGDLEIEGVSGLSGVEVRGLDESGVRFVQEGTTLTLHLTGRLDNPTRAEWLDALFDTLGRVVPLDVHLRVPADLTELNVRHGAGEIEVSGVTGRVELEVQTGDLKLQGADGFALWTRAGDVQVEGIVREGRSSVTTATGGVKVTLTEGSDTTVNAAVTVGELHTLGFALDTSEEKLGARRVRGRVASGRGHLDVAVSVGKLELVALGTGLSG